MCRHAAVIGPGSALTEIMWDLPHSLRHQAYQARELLTGVVCADGFGVGWYAPDERPEPGRYASAYPIWSDGNLPAFGPLVRSPLVVGAVRNATLAGHNDAANCAPFASGRHLLSHNGYLEDFASRWRDGPLRDWISPERRSLVSGATDSEHLFQALLSHVDARAGDPAALPTAVQELVQNVMGHASQEGVAAQMNLLVSDGRHLVATRAGTGRQNSLYLLQDGEEFPGASVVASEPLYDDPLWRPVAEDTVLVLQGGAPAVRLTL